MSKIYLCGMTGDRLKDITEATSCYDYFDGLVFVDHLSKDGTKELLESRKKDGLIISRPYVKQHHHSQNEILYSRYIKNESWIFWIDSPERIETKWLETIRKDIEEYNNNGIGAVYFSGRPYLFKYYDFQSFFGSPHWGLNYPMGKVICFGEENKYLYIKNNRDENPEDSYCLHPIKYWFVFNPSNECNIMYSKYGSNIVEKHEKIRQEFRLYCEFKLNLSLNSLDDLIEYMKKIEKKEIISDEYFINVVDNEFRLSELYELKVLNLDFMKQMHPRYKWSFRNHLKFNNGWIDTNYESIIIKYDKGIFN